jgi:hypothetical protein
VYIPDKMRAARDEAPTGLVCVKQNEDKPSCAEDTRSITGRIHGWLPVPSLAVCTKTAQNKRDCSEMRLMSAHGYTGQATYILRTKLISAGSNSHANRLWTALPCNVTNPFE